MKAKLFTVAAASIMLTGAAMAQESVFASTDLDVRSGPGREYPVVGLIGADREAMLLGCHESSGWCEVETGSVVGWVDSGYLVSADTGDDVYINEGPVDGVISGSIDGAAIDPAPPVITYIEENPYEPVYLEGEIAIGETLPETVEVYDIPDYEYRYVYVNDRPVLVEPDTRRIVYIVR